MAKKKRRQKRGIFKSLQEKAREPEAPVSPPTSKTPEESPVAPIPRELTDKVKRLETELSSVKNSLEGASSELSQLSSNVVTYEKDRTELGSLSENVQSLLMQLDEVAGKVQILATLNNAEALQELAHKALNGRIEDIRADMEGRAGKAREKLAELLEDIEDEADAYRKIVQEAPTGGIPVLQQRIEALEARLEHGDEQQEALHKQNEELRKTIADQEVEVHRLRHEDGRVLLDEIRGERDRILQDQADATDVTRLRADNAELLSKLEQLRTGERQRETSARVERELETAQRNLDDERFENKNLQRDKNRLNAQLRKTERTVGVLQEQLDTTQRTLVENERAIAEEEERTRQLEQARTDITANLDIIGKQRAEIDRLVPLVTRAQELARDKEWEAEEARRLARETLEDEYRDRFRAKHFELEESLDQRIENELAIAVSEANTLRQEVKHVRESLSSSCDRESDLQRELEEIRNASHERREELANEIQQRRERAARDLDEQRKKVLDDLMEQKASLEPLIVSLNKQQENLVLEVNALQKQRNELSFESQKLSVKVAELSEQLRQLEEREKQLRHIDLPRTERLADLCKSEIEHRDIEPLKELEIPWISEVQQRIEDSGFRFSERLLFAFHTSLKSATLSPITILAGISGTGKSELPRLYADLGGLRFANIAVQPNWDSPEDLFGFFNYTDGRFRATKLSRLLFQVTGKEPDVPLNDQMVLVLLDEMNIARVEYYFAELLSKLEVRRGLNADSTGWERAAVEIDAGAGRQPDRLFLDHNILFTGTMNEDESTLSLSDKVKDRATIITFPSPNRFHGRGELAPVPPRAKALARATWFSWVRSENQLPDRYRGVLADTARAYNEALRPVGRAIGHRVYQSISTYAANYPAVHGEENAWRCSLADVFAQKLIPKLVGIECSSRRGRECLEQVTRLLPDELGPAFTTASEDEYFSWQGSREILADSDEDDVHDQDGEGLPQEEVAPEDEGSSSLPGEPSTEQG